MFQTAFRSSCADPLSKSRNSGQRPVDWALGKEQFVDLYIPTKLGANSSDPGSNCESPFSILVIDDAAVVVGSNGELRVKQSGDKRVLDRRIRPNLGAR